MAKELIVDSNYKTWIKSLKKNIYSAQIKASVAVNGEMLRLYWNLGRDICDNQFESNYGSKFFETLSRDLKRAFPDVQGFSVSNLKYMKRFYLFYKEIRHQLGDEFENQIFIIPWRHHIEIFTKAKSKEEALFFVQKTKENGWSRAMLVNMMDTRLYETRGNTVNNFSLTLPKEDSECARQMLRDTYKLDFLTLLLFHRQKTFCPIRLKLQIL